MKIIQITLILIFSFISSSLAKEYIKDFDFNDADFIQSKYDVKYFINDGYKLVQQETSGTTTGYVLKKGDEYVGCRSVGLSKDQTCFIIVLKRVEWKTRNENAILGKQILMLEVIIALELVAIAYAIYSSSQWQRFFKLFLFYFYFLLTVFMQKI